jgi:APA family basic amino acid/polyamine antiporter
VSADAPASPEAPDARRVIGPLGGFAVVAGSMLGIGIFLSPPIVARHVSDPLLFLAVWAAGGLTALAGAVACAELGTLFPRAGGDYVFQREAFGPSVAFASGWSLFAAIFSGSIATMTVALCTYQVPALIGVDLAAYSWPLIGGLTLSGTQLAALGLIVALTALNLAGAGPSTHTQSVLTLLPVAVLTLFAGYAILRGGASAQPATPDVPLTLGGLVLAYNAVYFAYSGWINVIYVGGEVARPQRNIPFALIGGTLVVTLLYLLLCTGFLRVLGLDGIGETFEAGSATAGVLGGNTLQVGLTLLIASALLASVNGTVLGGARVAVAMAEGGAISHGLAALDARSGAPRRALWVQAAIACALVLSGRFEDLLNLVSLTMVLTGTLTVSCVYVLRRTRPELERPYRTTGYPWLPAIYLLSSSVVIGVMLDRALAGEPDALYPLLGLALFAVAYAGHRLSAARG